MTRARAVTTKNTGIRRAPGVRGGAPVIAGTGTRVLDVAIRYEVMRLSPEEIMVALPHLTLPQIHSALAYYYAHKSKLDAGWKASLKKSEQWRRRHPSMVERKLGLVKNLHR